MGRVRRSCAGRWLLALGLGLAQPALSVDSATPDILVPDSVEGQNQQGRPLYLEHCAGCHNGKVARAPKISQLKIMSPSTLLRVMESGAMKQQAQGLTRQQRVAVAEYLSGSRYVEEALIDEAQYCRQDNWFDHQEPTVQGWGFGADNRRHVDDGAAGLDRADIRKLKLKWAFEFPATVRARSQAAYAGGAVFVGSQDGTVYALDAASGCVHWTFTAQSEVRSAMALGRLPAGAAGPGDATPYLFFGDFLANVYAVNAMDGSLLWQAKVDDHGDATLTGSVAYFADGAQARVFVPVSSLESVTAALPDYQCCTFRGSVVALDAATGRQIWKTYTVAQEPRPTYVSSAGVQQFGPSGAAVWNAPTIDAKRRRIYFGTGQNYSSPAESGSDAIFALDMDSGEVSWQRQFVQGDAFNLACPYDGPNCPKEDGPDLDFGASPVLVALDADTDMLVVGHKSGNVYGLDPDKGGALAWQARVGRGSSTGGVHFGMAANSDSVFVPIYDPDFSLLPAYMGEVMRARFPGKAQRGLHAVNAATGEVRWSSDVAEACATETDCWGYSAAATATDQAVFACNRGGLCVARDTRNGELLWRFDTARRFETTSGRRASGGSIGGPGPLVARGRVFVSSGYYALDQSPAGNLLLMFEAQ
tara:strand:- start:656 stop:2593 length:1938 start_codon:yes stop_codon:yes gene_type:complete